jgi:glyoxylate/hydroxypyruvate reductase
MNVLLLAPELEVSNVWFSAIAKAVPGANLVIPGALPYEAITVAIVDGLPPGCLSELPNLRLIMSLSSGIDMMMADPDLPDVPIVRLVTPEMVALMREYVCYHVLRIHRGFAAIEQMHREMRWEWLSGATPAMCRRVLVMGLGEIGRPCAEALRDLGFQVFGWSRSQKELRGIRCVSGANGLESVLSETDILVSLLPLTSLTTNLLSAELFRRLPRGASIINVGRGKCLNESDLLLALDEGQLSHATLDVLTVEPLPIGHPFWSHSKVTLTPHTAAYPRPESFIDPIVHILRRLSRGEPLPLIEHRHKGY